MQLDSSQSQFRVAQVEKDSLISKSQKTVRNSRFEFGRQMKIKLYQNRFINKMRRSQLLYKSLTPFHKKVISDYSDQDTYCQGIITQTPNIWQKLNKSPIARFQRQITAKMNQLQSTHLFIIMTMLLRKIPIINPNNIFKAIWDVSIAMIRFYLLIIISTEVSFNNRVLYNQLAESVILCLLLLTVDVSLNFITAFYAKGQLITSHPLIFKNYIKSGFVLDLYCIITLSQEMINQINLKDHHYIDYLNQDSRIFDNGRDFISLSGIIVQMNNIFRVFNKLQNTYDFSEATSLLLDLLKLILFLFLLEHIFTCVWYFVGIRINGQTWITNLHLENVTYTEQYVTAFYFASVTMFTVGYGDVVPQNYIERIVTITFMILSTLQLSYTISAIWNVYSKLNEKHEERVRKMRAMNSYMKYRNISSDLRFKIREYLTFYWKQQSVEEDLEVKDIIHQLSSELQESLVFEASSIIMKECPLFNNYFSPQFKKQCLKLIQTLTLPPGKYLEVQEPCLYFIERGNIQVQFNKRTLRTLKSNENFCLREFILNENPKLQFYSPGFTKLIYIERSSLIKLLENYREDLEQFYYLRDCLLYNKYNFGQLCYSCNSLQHDISECPIITPRFDKQFIIKKYNFPQSSVRTYLHLRRKQKSKTIYNTNSIVPFSFNREQVQDELPFGSTTNNFQKLSHSDYFITYNEKSLNKLRQKFLDNQSDVEMAPSNSDSLEGCVSVDIDTIQDYKYYFPESNCNFKDYKCRINEKLNQIWNSLNLYLTFPYEFLKQHRSEDYLDNVYEYIRTKQRV